MALKLTFEIELRSDYHVSAGHGLGALVDSALQRDADGVPVLRGATLTGLLRDGLLRLLRSPLLAAHAQCQASGAAAPDYCGEKRPQDPDCPVCAIFGSPRTVRRWRTSAARPVDVPDLLADGDAWRAGETSSLIAPHVRVSPRTRRAEARKLFMREEGDSRLRFRFTLACEEASERAMEEAEWLVAAARNVRHLGASRRRGRGECRFHLVDVTTDGQTLAQPETKEGAAYPWEAWLLDRFQERRLENKLPQSVIDIVDLRPATAEPEAAVGSPVRLLLVARLDEPLIVSAKAEAGNEYHTVDYIPGSALRGALASRVAGRVNLDQTNSAEYAAFVDLFFRQRVHFSPLYPALCNGHDVLSAIPAPLDLLSCELYPGYAASPDSEAHGAWGFSRSDARKPCCPRCGSDMKPLGGFLTVRERPDRLELDHVTEMHVRIDPTTQRAAQGNLFGFHALEAGQYFMGVLSCKEGGDWQALRRLARLPNTGCITLRLGKASRRGYGQVTLWISPLDEAEGHPWVGASLQDRVPDLAHPLTLTLLTDAILPDRWGRFRTRFTEEWLQEQLRCPVVITRAFCAPRTVDSFNAHLGLPRWRDVAMSAGSAVGFQIVGDLSDTERERLRQRMQTLEQEGIGLRRHEGFGQVAFNHPLNTQWQLGEPGLLSITDNHIRLTSEMRLKSSSDHGLVQEAQFERKWQKRLDEEFKDAESRESGMKVFAYGEFESVARLLRTERPASVEAVQGLIDSLGDIHQLLPESTAAELAVWSEAKAKQNFFRSEDKGGPPGLRKLKRLTKLLADEAPEGSSQWYCGLDALADRIAAAARQGNQPTKQSKPEGGS